MKKTFFASAIFAIFLTACSSSTVKTEESNELTPGIMQPISASGASQNSYSWPSDIQSTVMPDSMK